MTQSPRDGTFLGVANSGIQFYVDAPMFDRSLFNALLLQRTVHVPDVWLFNSPHLVRHVNDPLRSADQSWLEAGLLNGAVVARMRDDRSLSELARDYADEGFMGSFTGEVQVANRLERSLVDARPWCPPGNDAFGVTYLDRLRDYFGSEAPGGLDGIGDRHGGESVMEFWTRPHVVQWRSELLERAVQRTTIWGHEGVRLSDVVAVATEFASGSDDAGLVAHPQIRDAARLANEHHGAAIADDLVLFLQMCAELYNENFAHRIGCRVSSVGIRQQTAHVLVNGQVTDAAEGEQRQLAVVELPSVEALRAMPGRTLTELRKYAKDNYFAALDEWETAPNPDETVELARRLTDYAAHIRKPVGGPGRRFAIDLSSAKELAAEVASGAAMFAMLGEGTAAIVGPVCTLVLRRLLTAKPRAPRNRVAVVATEYSRHPRPLDPESS